MHIRHCYIRSIVAVAALFGTSMAAYAQSCSFSITDVNFGAVDLTLGTSIDVTATFTATCSGSIGTVRVCPNIGSGAGGAAAIGSPRYMLNGANQLSFDIYQDAARSVVWGSVLDGGSSNPPVVDVPILVISNTVTRTLYGRILATQQTKPTGSYLSSFAGGHTLISYRNGTGRTCAQIGTQNGIQAPFTAQTTYAPTCRVSAAALNFGTVAGTSFDSGVDAATSLTATCSAATPYAIALNGGLTAANDPTRRVMAMGTNTILYGLYQNAARTSPWGATNGANTVGAAGTGSAQVFSVFGRVGAQVLPPPGTYSDTVVVTLTY